MKSVRKSTYEKGQAIVLIAAMMIGMIAMIGLAVDGGGLYFLDRDLQNAVDAAIVASVYAKCAGGDLASIQHAGEQAAADNGFVEGSTATLVEILNPPPPGIVPPGVDPDDYISVRIRAEKDPYFIQVVYSGDLEIEASGVGYCKESTVNTSGRALFASCEGTGDAIVVQASGHCSGDIVGGTHSNADTRTGPGTCVEGDVSTSGSSDQVQGTSLPSGDDLEDVAEEGVDVRNYPFVWLIEDFNETSDEYPQRIMSRWDSPTPGSPKHYGTLPSGFFLTGGGLATQLMAEGFADPRLEPLLIYVDGDLRIKSEPAADETRYYVTFAVTGTIVIEGNQNKITYNNAGQYPLGNVLGGDPTNWASGESDNGMDYLLFFSNRPDTGNCQASSGNTSIDLNGNHFLWDGITYAPFGSVSISGSTSGTSYGAIWSRTIFYSISGMTLEFDTSWLPPDPPSGGITD